MRALVALLLAFGAFAAACGDDDGGSTSAGGGGSGDEGTADAPAEPVTMRVAMQQNNFACIGLTLADDLGFFEDEGITFEMTIGESTSTMTAGLVGGSFDVQMGGPELILAHQEGVPIVGVASNNNAPVWSFVADEEITDIDGLRGATIGTSGPDTVTTLVVRLALREAGIEDDEYEVVTSGGSGARYTALQQGQIDATVVSSPFEFVAEDEGMSNLGGLVELEPEFNSAVIVVSESFADSRRDDLVRFLRAYVRALEWIHDPANEADLIERSARITELDPEVLQQAYDYWIGGEFGELMFPPDGRISVPSLENVAEGYVDIGVTDTAPDVDGFVDDQYIDEALETL